MEQTAFDAGRYLRALAGRTADVHPVFQHRPTPLSAATQALVAAGRIDEPAAQRILDEHEEALRSRDPRRSMGWTREWPRGPLAPRRVALGTGEELPHRGGSLRVRYVVFGETTQVAFAARRPWRFRFTRAARLPFDLRSDTTVAGDDGRPIGTGFSGHTVGRRRWEGTLRCARRLDPATRSIAIDGTRFQLIDNAPQVAVRVEPLAPADAALRHLWRSAALAGPFNDPHIEDAIGALVAAGAIGPDHPELAEVRAVAAALSLTGEQRTTAAAALRDPWASLWQTDQDGPDRTIPLGIVTPLFDGVTVAVNVLESSVDVWTLAVDLAPEGASAHPFETPTARLAGLVWWAEDDRGHRYLATNYALGGNAAGGSGWVTFEAPLDPRARWIELQPTAENTRAVIRVPLEG